MSSLPRLLIDATDCSVKAEIYRLAQRYGLAVVLVSAEDIGAPFEPWITKVVAGAGSAVVETIANETAPRDVVVTNNEALAARVADRGGQAFTTRGQRWTPQGPHPYLPESQRSNNKARFEAVLGDALHELIRAKV